MQEPPLDCILVCVNRPGYFGSDPVRMLSEEQDLYPNLLHNYSHKHFAADIRQLADHLHVSRFIVAGHSSGGPCALGCAAHLPDMVTAVGLLSSDPEYAHPAAPDKKWINSFCIGTVLPNILEKCLCCLPMARLSCHGLRQDYRMDTTPYSFRTQTDIAQPVVIYVGQCDQVLSVPVARHVQASVGPAVARLQVVPHVGHLGLLHDPVLHEFLHELLVVSKSNTGGGGGGGATTRTETTTTTTAPALVEMERIPPTALSMEEELLLLEEQRLLDVHKRPLV
jgi:pimeloyl-ACP methyl ester carboxylesterase